MAVLKTLTVNGVTYKVTPPASENSVTLLASAWAGSGIRYSQVVAIDGVTEDSQVDLTPSEEQLATFYEKDITFVTENDGGVVTVYVIGDRPTNDYTIQVTITEVERTSQKIFGVTVGTTISPEAFVRKLMRIGYGADLSQNDPNQPDYVKNRTHWEEDTRNVIEWNGNTEGLAVYKYGVETYYRISSNRPAEEYIVGSIVTFSDNRIASHVVTESEVAGFENNRVALISDCLLIIDMPTNPGVVTENGTYARIKDGPFGSYYPATFSYGSITVHQLDEKFIPESITRKAGVHVGSDEPPEGVDIWIDPNGEPTGSADEWTFTLEDGTTETKSVVIIG